MLLKQQGGKPNSDSLERRRFLKMVGLGLAATTLGSLPAVGQDTQSASNDRWRIGTPAFKADSMFQNLALEKGFFADEGIDAEIVGLESSATITRAVLAGELEMGSCGAGSPIVAIAKGANLRMIGSVFSRVPHLMYANKSIQSLEDLLGKNVGGAQPGALLQQLAYASFVEAGLDADAVQFVNTGGSPATFQAVSAGLVQAGVAGSEYALLLEADPAIPVHVLFPIAERLPNFLRNADFVHTNTIENNRDLVVRAVRAYLRGVIYALENKDEAVAWTVKNAGADEATAIAVWDEYVNDGFVNREYAISPKQVEFTQKVNILTGAQTEVVDYNQMVDTSITKDVLASL
ncbi:ABC transporter substrate-binding protein [Aurantimonas sp. C2-6-R+9]